MVTDHRSLNLSMKISLNGDRSHNEKSVMKI